MDFWNEIPPFLVGDPEVKALGFSLLLNGGPTLL